MATAKEQLMAANVGSNATHQQNCLRGDEKFYDFNTARQKGDGWRKVPCLKAATAVSDAANARIHQWPDHQADFVAGGTRSGPTRPRLIWTPPRVILSDARKWP